MNISSFNITDVGYHYIGLRVLGAMPQASREDQNATISRSVLKYARDRSLRLMLPEPKSTYETVGEKICQELVHFKFSEPKKGRGYELTTAGREILALLTERRFVDVRRKMALVHLKTYTNLQVVVHSHILLGGILSPTVEATKPIDVAYVATLLRPTFKDVAEAEAASLLERLHNRSPKQIEDGLREEVLRQSIKGLSLGVPLFRAMTDRLVSLRLLNSMRTSAGGAEFLRTYSPCLESPPVMTWHHLATTPLGAGGIYTIYLSEPNFDDDETVNAFISAIDEAFVALPAQAGYFDLPDVRDFVCAKILIPEASFDEGVISLLERPKAPITLGLTYEKITGRRKPLVRLGESAQIYNLIRRT
ncbi:MAG: hypothetical protein E5Y65_19850 [Mesorhizobium sp.]|uniref:hypothetical protein n=1 Tax=Mesorhizobium sp. TaxID=1871066 RepID=UPI0011FFA5AC|nr:hypothetical protein [Mesorhizobium sp.]TIL75141.1 MAG: hypothetical protein E5Y70_09430 [Mesorhizobium sp.]TIL88500.1 MAG: hypothetical protein E5Y65_19850 [Mesorhizobium sp.]TIL99787.1 MAG: hypothetical protein E5Y64_19875 [Mesorhizobium sp.]TIN21010.1 MAG: hypothetical protein E5Y59_02810 [Mesorhizobium sp.]